MFRIEQILCEMYLISEEADYYENDIRHVLYFSVHVKSSRTYSDNYIISSEECMFFNLVEKILSM